MLERVIVIDDRRGAGTACGGLLLFLHLTQLVDAVKPENRGDGKAGVHGDCNLEVSWGQQRNMNHMEELD